jgi:hypothetical protein
MSRNYEIGERGGSLGKGFVAVGSSDDSVTRLGKGSLGGDS